MEQANLSAKDGFHLLEVVERILDEVKKSQYIIQVSKRGLEVTKRIPEILILEPDYYKNLKKKNRITDFEIISQIANDEVTNRFPFLNAHAAVMLYSYLESGIKRIVMAYLKNMELSKVDSVASIKIKFAEFISLDENERFDYLFRELEKNTAAGLKYGVNRFEALLESIKFSGPVNKKTSSALFELSQIRNVILHQGSIADRHFVASCPSLGYKLGDKVKVTQDQLDLYLLSVIDYLWDIMVRIGEKAGRNMTEFKSDLTYKEKFLL